MIDYEFNASMLKVPRIDGFLCSNRRAAEGIHTAFQDTFLMLRHAMGIVQHVLGKRLQNRRSPSGSESFSPSKLHLSRKEALAIPQNRNFRYL
jgi:hypothetical protein